jgi:hypothetical protein
MAQPMRKECKARMAMLSSRGPMRRRATNGPGNSFNATIGRPTSPAGIDGRQSDTAQKTVAPEAIAHAAKPDGAARELRDV